MQRKGMQLLTNLVFSL